IPVAEAIKLACEADILPAVFNTKTQKLWLGRKHRSATEAQRCALIVRDKHCVGCGRTPTWCEAHHIQHWAHGGETNLDNLVLVCTSCHHNIHDNGWQVVQNQDGKYDLRPPPKPHTANRTPPGEHGNHRLRPPPKSHANTPTQGSKHAAPTKRPDPFGDSTTNTDVRPPANQQTALIS
ncbi:MAG: HNH endonuclease signature motif containing protein, partial [bacterium]|nr:HNH endonuclease signature motif containing protein [bacterium]